LDDIISIPSDEEKDNGRLSQHSDDCCSSSSSTDDELDDDLCSSTNNSSSRNQDTTSVKRYHETVRRLTGLAEKLRRSYQELSESNRVLLAEREEFEEKERVLETELYRMYAELQRVQRDQRRCSF
jgi:hypothetical protein